MATAHVEIQENQIAREVVDASIQVHRTLGPGLLESVYEAALTIELSQRGLEVVRQYPITVEYRGVALGEGYRADMLVRGKVLLELKSVERVQPVHKKQLLTYLRLSDRKLGLLLNFGEALMKNGITRIVNGLAESPPRPKP